MTCPSCGQPLVQIDGVNLCNNEECRERMVKPREGEGEEGCER